MLQHNFSNSSFIYSVIFVLILLVLPAVAQASSIGSVGGPTVKKGVTQVNYRVGYHEANEESSQDQRLRHRVHADFGLTDSYAFRLIGALDDRKGDNTELDGVTIENRFYLLSGDDGNYDLGARLFYTVKDGNKKPDGAGISFHQDLRQNGWRFRFNQFFRIETGAERSSGVSFEFRAQAVRPVVKGWRAGLESFSSFGEFHDMNGFDQQDHTVGPVIIGQVSDNLELESGYRMGLTDGAPDHTFKLFLNKSF